MFAKIINNTVEIYPYNPQSDYPLTSFPVGASYPAFNCYWVYSTTPLNPNTDLYDSVETTPVFNGTTWEQSWEYVEKPPQPPKHNWDMFNTQMMTNARFNQVYNQCLQIAPIVANSLPTALDQVTSKPSLSLFTLIWTQLCQIGGATAEDKQVWGEFATANNLPQDFINILTT